MATSLNEKYIKRKKRRRIAWIAFAIGTSGCVALGIIAFLGRTSGMYTIQMKKARQELVMSDISDFSHETTFLAGNGLTEAASYTADLITRNQSNIDAGDGSHNGNENGVDNYLAYTFYVKNKSLQTVDFSVNLSIDNFGNSNGETSSIIDVLRVRWYANYENYDPSNVTHDNVTYALRAKTPWTLTSGETVEAEPISQYYQVDKASRMIDLDYEYGSIYTKCQYEENRKFTTPFVSENMVFDNLYERFPAQAVMRFTTVIWIEGYDAQCEGYEPKGSYVTMSLNLQLLRVSDDEESSESTNESSESNADSSLSA
ncbi:MAG: hypothetical protein K5694_06435 [Bacilli bacterium]|nr:hypothetical protein [Bacilli bacterium]